MERILKSEYYFKQVWNAVIRSRNNGKNYKIRILLQAGMERSNKI